MGFAGCPPILPFYLYPLPQLPQPPWSPSYLSAHSSSVPPLLSAASSQAWPAFLPLNVGPPLGHRGIDTLPPPPLASQFQCPPQPGPPHLPGPRFSPQLSSPALPQTSYRSPCHLAAQVHFPQQNLSVVSSLPDHQPWVDPCSGGVPLRPPGRISSSACSDLQCLTLDSFFPKTGILSLGQLSGPVLSRHAPAFEADVSLL